MRNDKRYLVRETFEEGPEKRVGHDLVHVRDAIDHAVRKGDVISDPLLQSRIAESRVRKQDLADDMVISLQIVTRHDRKGRQSTPPAPVQCLRHETYGGDRLVSVLKIVLDVGMIGEKTHPCLHR